jgi:hypothetical protein
MQRKTAELVTVLRQTLKDVQDSVWTDSPAIQELKRCLLQTIASLESDLKEEPVTRR